MQRHARRGALLPNVSENGRAPVPTVPAAAVDVLVATAAAPQPSPPPASSLNKRVVAPLHRSDMIYGEGGSTDDEIPTAASSSTPSRNSVRQAPVPDWTGPQILAAFSEAVNMDPRPTTAAHGHKGVA